MTRPFRFALQARDLSDRDRATSLARQAEHLGYEELYCADHLGSVDPFVPLIVAAEATSTLRVGTLVLNNELHHPGLLARTAATVDRLTGGRLVLGMGAGYAQVEHDALGIELRPPAARVERFEDSVVALRSLLDTGSVHMRGPHHWLDIDDLGIKPRQRRLPILVGGHGPRMIAVGGRLADIFQFTGLTHQADGTPTPGGFELDVVVDRARLLTEAAGDRGDVLQRSLLVQQTHIGDGADDAIADAADRLGVDRRFIDSTPFLLLGSLERIVDKLESLRERLGISHVVVRDAEDFAPVVAALAGH